MVFINTNHWCRWGQDHTITALMSINQHVLQPEPLQRNVTRFAYHVTWYCHMSLKGCSVHHWKNGLSMETTATDRNCQVLPLKFHQYLYKPVQCARLIPVSYIHMLQCTLVPSLYDLHFLGRLTFYKTPLILCPCQNSELICRNRCNACRNCISSFSFTWLRVYIRKRKEIK